MALPKTKEFDGAKFATMEEPLTVRVERQQPGSAFPGIIPLPNSGVMNKADVADLESIVLGLAGGGNFTAYVTDAKGVSMSWRWSETAVPPKVPDSVSEAIAAGGQVPFQPPPMGYGQPQPPQYPPQPQYAVPPVPRGPYGSVPPAAMYGYPGFANPMMPPPQQQFWYPPPQQGGDSDVRRQLDAERQARIDAEHKAERERDRQAIQQQMAESNRRFEALQTTIQQMHAAPKADPALEVERERRQAAEARLEREAADRRWAEMKADSDRKFEVLTRELAESRNSNRTDPMAEAFKENARAQAEAAKAQAQAQVETARLQAEAAKAQAEALRPMIMGPREYSDIVRAAKDDNSAAATLVQTMAASMGNMLNLQGQAFGQMIEQMSQGAASPALQLVGQGLENTRMVFEKWLMTKETGKVADARARAQEATARIAEARSSAMAGAQEPGPAKQLPGAKPAAAQAGAKVHQLPPPDTRLFGPAMNAIAQARTFVYEGSWSAENVVEAVFGAMKHYDAVRDQIPAFKLIDEGKFREFFDALVPKAPEDFRAACAHLFVETLEQIRAAANGQGGAPAGGEPGSEPAGDDEGDGGQPTA